MPEESIVVVERRFLPERAEFNGVRRGAKPFLSALAQHWFAAPRSEAESRVDWKQPIPYIVLRKNEAIFATVRSSDGREARLRNMTSVGIGGHLRPGDRDSFRELLLDNAHRELTEELVVNPTPSTEELASRLEFIGVINDESNEVGRCHLGFLYVLDLEESETVDIREVDNLSGGFQRPEDIPRGASTETWSTLALALLEESNVDAE